jgi:hypothetical protein
MPKKSSLLVPPKMKSSKTVKLHRFSPLLQHDPRAATPPRLVRAISGGKNAKNGVVWFAKVYSALGAVGAELLTLSCVFEGKKEEFEIRFDERFAVSIHFKTQSDEERTSYAKDQIERQGGFERLTDLFSSVFGNQFVNTLKE